MAFPYPRAVEVFEAGMVEALTYLDFPSGHRRRIRMTNGLERLFQEIKPRTRNAEATLQNITLLEDSNSIELWDSAQATIRANEIMSNGDYGVVLNEAPCFGTDETFTGVVEGGMNTFDGNAEGPVCPSDELDFLMTEEGGELDRRE